MPKLNEKILFVDDDENILLSYKRQLRKTANTYTANGGEEGLKIIQAEGPFAVVISDMRMPSMNGAEFLAKVKSLTPNTIRIVLTGQSDIESAVEAINNGQIFRFLTKPCPPQMMAEALVSAVGQYRLVTAENELLERTLKESINVLTEVLSMANPIIFGQDNRFKYYVKQLITQLGIENSWDIEVAAMLSNLGYITLHEGLIHKISKHEELNESEVKEVVDSTNITVKLLSNIPRMSNVTSIIEAQHAPFKLMAPVSQLSEPDRIKLCGHVLKIAKQIDRLLNLSHTLEEIVKIMLRSKNEFDYVVTKQILLIQPMEDRETLLINVSQLSKGMIVDQDIRHNNGALLISRGHEVNEASIVHLVNHGKNNNFRQPFKVIKTQKKNLVDEQ